MALAGCGLLMLNACEVEPVRAKEKTGPQIIEPSGAGKEKATPSEDSTEVAVMLNPNLPLDEIPDVMKEVVSDMTHQFPGVDFTAVAYMPTSPPTRVGTAHLDATSGKVVFRWDLPKGHPPLEKGVMRI